MTDTKNVEVKEKFEPGNKVHYSPSRTTKRENGIVKSVTDLGVFVVYNCAGEWSNYKDYTAALTDPSDLKLGWV